MSTVTTELIPTTISGYAINVLNILLNDTTSSRQIISIPSQIGCNNACSFCISKNQELVRNLTSSELAYLFNSVPITSSDVELSFTGEGEPLHNIKSINEFANQADVSSVKLAFSGLGSKLIANLNINRPTTLQFSLHQADQTKRNLLIPRSDKLVDIRDNLLKYQHKFSKININYVIIPGKNDSIEDLDKLEHFVAGTNWNVLVNPLIEETTVTIPQNNVVQLPQSVKFYKLIAQSISDNNLYSQLTYKKLAVIV